MKQRVFVRFSLFLINTVDYISSVDLKVPLLWVMKGSYFGYGLPSNRLTCMQGQKTLSLSYACMFTCSTTHFSSPSSA